MPLDLLETNGFAMRPTRGVSFCSRRAGQQTWAPGPFTMGVAFVGNVIGEIVFFFFFKKGWVLCKREPCVSSSPPPPDC